jgi:hypothetical protein
MRISRTTLPTASAVALASSALLAGCSTSSGGASRMASSSSAAGPAVRPAPDTRTDARSQPVSRPDALTAVPGPHRPRASAATVRGLPASRADPEAIQAQPPPGSCHARGSGRFSLPDPRCTPGAIDPAVRDANIAATICHAGYTRSVRPPESITEHEKQASLAAYGDSGPLGDYEYDHLVPLELGGASNDPRNLWPEPGAIPNPKDELENRLRSLVCAGGLRLAAAQREIAEDWIAAYRRLIG